MDKLTLENEAKLLEAIGFIDKIVAVGKSALEKFPTGDYDLLVFTFINYLERFTHNLEAVNILLREYKDKPNIETSIGLTIRASLLDFMTITYLSTYQADILSKDDKENEAKFNKQFDGLMTDQIHNTIKYLKLTRDVGLITKDDYKVAIENSWHTYSFLFTDKIVDYENPESKLISKEHKSPKQYFTRIHNHPLTKKFSMVYDLYTYYSKYEHFGIMTHFMQRQGVNNDFDMIIASMKYMTRGIGASFSYLSYPVDKLKIEKEAMDELQNNFDKL
jgi:hypothetical protein